MVHCVGVDSNLSNRRLVASDRTRVHSVALNRFQWSVCLCVQASIGCAILFASYVVHVNFDPFITFAENDDDSKGGLAAKAGSLPAKSRWLVPLKRVVAVFIGTRPTNISHNALESAFLISSMCVLMAGMVFVSDGFGSGSVGYGMLTWGVALLIVCAVTMFATLVVVEVYRSIRYHSVHVAARKAEVERAEQLLRPGRKSSAGLARRASDAFSRRASIAATLSNAAWNRFSAHRRQSVLKRSVLNAFASAGTTKVAGSESPQDTGSTGIAPAPTILKRSLLQAVIASAAAMKAAETATITISESPPAADEVIGVGAAVPVVDAHGSGRQTGGVIAPALREERALRVAKSRRMVAKR